MSEQRKPVRRVSAVSSHEATAGPTATPYVPRPRAIATVERQRQRMGASSEYQVTLTLELGSRKVDGAGELARQALLAFAPVEVARERRELVELSAAGRSKAGGAAKVTTGVEARMVWPEQPDEPAMARLRDALVAGGYRVDVQERRACSQAGCFSEAFVAWFRPAEVPAGWFSSAICGRHDYRRCAGCDSIFQLQSSNAVGQAPSLSCEVCGTVLVEWGSSKRWEAQLIVRGERKAGRGR